MVSLARSDAVVALGKRLVAQLEADDDLLASWMAHHIADLLAQAEAAAPDERGAAEGTCAQAILDLWRHRNVLPQHLRPLDEVAPILRALAFLDLNPQDIRYYPSPMRAAVLAGVKGDVKHAIELALGVDYTARVLIRMLLQQAAAAAVDDVVPWVELARAAGAEDGGEQRLLELMLNEDETENAEDESIRAVLRDRLNRLEAFAGAAAAEATELRKRLGDGDNIA